MKIKITTVREFPDRFLKDWFNAVSLSLSWLNLGKVIKGEPQSFTETDDEVDFRVTTTVERIK